MLKCSLPAKPYKGMCRFVIDSREQKPFEFKNHPVVVKSCDVGDYQLYDFPNQVAVERKSLEDLVNCCGTERDRFERQLLRLLGVNERLVVIEGSWEQIEMGQWRSRINTLVVQNSILGWIAKGIPFVLAGNRTRAAEITEEFLWLAWRRKYGLARSLVKELEEG